MIYDKVSKKNYFNNENVVGFIKLYFIIFHYNMTFYKLFLGLSFRKSDIRKSVSIKQTNL